MIDSRFLDLLQHLYRGGQYAHYWHDKISRWFPVDQIPELPAGWTDNVYFTVNPSAWRRTEFEKLHNVDVAAINALYFEVDNCKLEDDIQVALDRIQQLPFQPAVIVASGGGLHCYVLLRETFQIVDEAHRRRARLLQKAMVRFTGGDAPVHDIARILRVPGTFNKKTEYAPNYPEVKILTANFNSQYSIKEIEQILELTMAELQEAHTPAVQPTATPQAVSLSDQELLDVLFKSKNGANYERLWRGDLSVCGGDHSKCDQFLANGLAWLTGGDSYRMDSLFRQSGLMRDKWNRNDYRDQTLHNAITSATQFYDPGYHAVDQEAIKAAQPFVNGNGTTPHVNGNRASPQPQPTPVQPKTTKKSKGSGLPTYSEIGREFIKQSPFTLYSRGQWYRYVNGVWISVHDLVIRQEVWTLLETYVYRGLYPSISGVNNVEAYSQANLYIPEDLLDNDDQLINLQNGTYSLELQCLLTHSEQRYLTTQLPFSYDTQGICPTWKRYLETTFIDRNGNPDFELINFIQEAIGYSLTTDIRYHIMFWCYGEGANGKGVLFHVLEALAGNAAMPFNVNLLHREQYQLADLAGKRIALCPEADSSSVVEDDIVKALVAGDSLQVRQIRKEPFTLKPTVKLWWSMNKLPTVTDTSTGFWRRLAVIPFNADFEKRQRVQRIDNLKELLDFELPGIFNWAMEGLNRLHSNNAFTRVKQIEEWTENYRQESNTIAAFIDDECELGRGFNIASHGIYSHYRDWCSSNGYKAYNVRNFKTEMERLGYYHRRTMTMRVFDGLRMKGGGSAIP